MSKPSNSKTQNKKTLDPYLARCEDILRKAGSKITKPRMAVLQCMADAMTSLSPRQIHQRIEANQLAPDVDQVSVYRILETFLEIGLVHQVHPSGEYIPCTHVDCEEDLHILTCCKACDTTEEIDIPASLFAPTSWHLKHKHGFSIQGQLIQIDGLCATCADSHHHGAQA